MNLFAAVIGRVRAEAAAFRSAIAEAPDPPPGFDLAGLRKPLGKAAHALVHEHGSPMELAAAIWLGAVIGTTPLYGLHVVLCVALGMVLRLNKLAMWLAANVSLPIFAPFLAFLCVQVAHHMLHRQWLPLSPQWFVDRRPQEVFAEFWGLWMLGSIPVGAGVGLPMALLTFAFVSRRRERADPFLSRFHGARRTIRRTFLPQVRYWKEGPIWKFHWKSWLDPVYARVLQELPPDVSMLDVGGGEGYLPMLHAQMWGTEVPRLVVDLDDRRLAEGRVIAATVDLPVRHQLGDARDALEGTWGCVACLDVLHYLQPLEQDDLLTRMASALAPGGWLVVRDIDAAAGERARWTERQERVAIFFGRTRAGGVFARPAAELARTMERCGLDVRVVDGSEGTGAANVIFFARKPA